MMNIIGNPLVSWSHHSEDDSGFETSSAISDFFPRRSGFSFHNRHKATHTERSSQKLIRGKIQKRSSIAPYLPARSIIRRKSIQELRLPPILSSRGLLKYTRAFQKGNCIYIGKAAAMAMDGDFDDLISVPSSSSSSSDSPSYILTSPPRCSLNLNPATRRRHSLYAKVYSAGHKISSVAEEDSSRSIVDGLDLDRSASCIEATHQILIPSASLSSDFSGPQMETTLNRFNSLRITMKNGDIGIERPSQFSAATDDLCSQFSMMTTPSQMSFSPFNNNQPHSTGHSPFSSPNPWPSTVPSASAQDLLTPVASDQ